MKIYKEGNAYEIIQGDVEEQFCVRVDLGHYDVRNICIVGAYHGYEIQRLKTRYPYAIIYAFEAHPTHFAILEQRCRGLDNVFLYNEAVCDYHGEVDFYEISIAGSGSILKFQGEKFENCPAKIVETIKVPCVQLTERLGPIDIDLLWVDVQGAELKVLKGSDLRLIKSMFLEVHTKDHVKPWDLEPYEGQCYLEDLQAFLKDTHELVAIGLDNENGNGQGNSFWIRKDYV
jgi:FkbM family methyltransferase